MYLKSSYCNKTLLSRHLDAAYTYASMDTLKCIFSLDHEYFDLNTYIGKSCIAFNGYNRDAITFAYDNGATSKKSAILTHAVSQNDFDMVKLLINYGYTAEDFDHYQITSYCLNNLDMLTYLISYGLNINAKGYNNMTVLNQTISWSYEKFKLLLELGAHIDNETINNVFSYSSLRNYGISNFYDRDMSYIQLPLPPLSPMMSHYNYAPIVLRDDTIDLKLKIFELLLQHDVDLFTWCEISNNRNSYNTIYNMLCPKKDTINLSDMIFSHDEVQQKLLLKFYTGIHDLIKSSNYIEKNLPKFQEKNLKSIQEFKSTIDSPDLLYFLNRYYRYLSKDHVYIQTDEVNQLSEGRWDSIYKYKDANENYIRYLFYMGFISTTFIDDLFIIMCKFDDVEAIKLLYEMGADPLYNDSESYYSASPVCAKYIRDNICQDL